MPFPMKTKRNNSLWERGAKPTSVAMHLALHVRVRVDTNSIPKAYCHNYQPEYAHRRAKASLIFLQLTLKAPSVELMATGSKTP